MKSEINRDQVTWNLKAMVRSLNFRLVSTGSHWKALSKRIMWLISTTAQDGRRTIKGQDRRQVVHAWTGATAAVQDRDTDGLNKACHARDVKK